MTLVWHIARKDIRRFALPIIAWLALLAVPTIVFRLKSLAIDGQVASSIDTLVTLFSNWGRLLTGMQALLGYVIASSLVLDDPLVATNGWWTTRPIARGRLLAAKLVGAACLFGALPLIVLAPIWAASGFNLVEMTHAAGEFLRLHGSIVLLALAVASLSRNLAQVLFFTIVIVAVYLGAGLIATHFLSIRYRHSSEVLTSALPIMVGVIAACQFLMRRPMRTWISLAAAIVALLALQVERIDGLSGFDVRSAGMGESEGDRAVKIDVLLGNFSPHANSAPSLVVKAPWDKDERYVPMHVRLPDGKTGRGPSGVGLAESGRRVLGFSTEAGPMQWQVMLPWLTGRPASELHAVGLLEVWAVRTVVVGELPVALGGEARHGATSTRIVELIRRDDRLDAIIVEERDSRARLKSEVFRHFDHYYLVDRKRNTILSAHDSLLGSIHMNSLATRFRRLHVSGDGDWKEGVLIRLRFERERHFARPFQVEGITLMTP